MTIKHPLLLLTLPSLVVAVIQLTSWSVAPGFSDWGAWLDAVALAAAFLIGHAFAAPSPSDGGPEPTAFDHLLQRMAGATFGAIPATAVAVSLGFVRLDGVELAPVRGTAHGTVGATLALGAFFVGLMLAALVYAALRRAGPTVLAAMACVLAIGAGATVISSGASDRRAFEAMQPSFQAVDLPPLQVDIVTREVSVDGVDWVYAAAGSVCAFVTKRTADSPAAIVRPQSSDRGFAVCPPLELRRSGDEVFGVVPGVGSGSLEFTIKGGVVRSSSGVRSFEAERQLSAERASRAEKIRVLPSIRAARGRTSDEHEEAGLEIERNAVQLQSCLLRIEHGSAKILEKELPFSRGEDYLELCPGVAIDRSALLDLASVRLLGSGRSELPSVVLLRGYSVERVRLADVASRFRPPAAWISLAGVGVGAASILILVGLVQIGRQRRWRGFALAHHEGDGTVTFEDDRRVLVPGASSLPIGDVMVRGEAPALRPGAYRAGSELPRAELEVWEATWFRHTVERLDTCCLLAPFTAIALVLVTSALLWVGWAIGLL